MNPPATIWEAVSGWWPLPGDLSWTGGLMVAAYALAACLTWFACRSAQSAAARLAPTDPWGAASEQRLAWFWLMASLAVMALGINKQLDLQYLLVESLREVSHAQGWYDDRRRYQLIFILTVAALGLVSVLTAGWVLRRVLVRVWMAVLGLGWITSFVVIRAASFHYVDTFLRNMSHAGNVALELSGIALIAAGATHALRLGQRTP